MQPESETAEPFVAGKRIRFHHCDLTGIVFFPQYFVPFNEVIEDWYTYGLDTARCTVPVLPGGKCRTGEQVHRRRAFRPAVLKTRCIPTEPWSRRSGILQGRDGRQYPGRRPGLPDAADAPPPAGRQPG